MPNFDPFNAPTDTIYVSGHPSPGIAEVYDVKTVHNWRERRGYGFSGATLAYRGKALCRFKVKLTLITAEDFDAWEDFLQELQPPPADPPTWTSDDAASLAFLEGDLQRDPNFELARLQRVSALQAQRTRAANAGRSQGRHLDVQHPILEMHRISAAAVETIDGPRQAGDGEWIIEIAFIEYRRPTFAASVPEGIRATPRDNDPVMGFIDERNDEIEDLNRQHAALTAAQMRGGGG